MISTYLPRGSVVDALHLASETVVPVKRKLIKLLEQHGHISPDGKKGISSLLILVVTNRVSSAGPYDFDAVPPSPPGFLVWPGVGGHLIRPPGPRPHVQIL